MNKKQKKQLDNLIIEYLRDRGKSHELKVADELSDRFEGKLHAATVLVRIDRMKKSNELRHEANAIRDTLVWAKKL